MLHYARARELELWLDLVAVRGEVIVQFWLQPGEAAVTLGPGTSALVLGGLLLDAQDLLGRRVDVVTEAGLHPALRERVMASALPL